MRRDTTAGEEKWRIPGKKEKVDNGMLHLRNGGWFSWVTAGREGKEEGL